MKYSSIQYLQAMPAPVHRISLVGICVFKVQHNLNVVNFNLCEVNFEQNVNLYTLSLGIHHVLLLHVTLISLP